MKRLEATIWAAAGALALAALTLAPAANADQVIVDDLIVDGSICAGQDCVNGESFGFDTLRLKENNLRIKFQDTSTSASFPTNDWQLTANDSSNGGANKFSIDDIDGGRTPFTIEAGAPSHSLYVDDGGRIGFGTSTPVAELHVKVGNTPTLRLEQDGSSGFTPQTWDVAGNEANFFIRDATNGSTLPLRIFPSAPSAALTIEGSTGDIGVGLTAPEASVHAKRTSATNVGYAMENATSRWDARVNAGGDFQLTLGASGGAELLIRGGVVTGNTEKYIFAQGTDQLMEIEGDGDVNSKTGVFGMLSDRNAKTDINAVDTRAILARVAEMPISTWRYKANSDELHMGPMAQDFWAAFGLHEGEKNIALNDLSGVALAAIKGLNEELEQKSATIADLMARIEALEAAQE